MIHSEEKKMRKQRALRSLKKLAKFLVNIFCFPLIFSKCCPWLIMTLQRDFWNEEFSIRFWSDLVIQFQTWLSVFTQPQLMAWPSNKEGVWSLNTYWAVDIVRHPIRLPASPLIKINGPFPGLGSLFPIHLSAQDGGFMPMFRNSVWEQSCVHLERSAF